MIFKVLSQPVPCLYSQQPVQPLLILLQLLLSPTSVDLLKPPELLSSPFLSLFHAHAATWHFTREGKLHTMNFLLVKCRATPLFQLYRDCRGNKEQRSEVERMSINHPSANLYM